MTLGEQAARRIALARQMGCEPRRWVATSAAVEQLKATVEPDAWGADGAQLHGIPLKQGRPRSDWGLDLISAPSAGVA